ncbi:MAG: deoxynucleoside kinase [Bacteroidetes bacterium]|nr:deoxynucleoside kinase [Bacteroidota bacterium]
MKYNYIAIEGNIGAGKTTLTHKLAELYNAELILEEFAENSFLDKFYKQPEQYAFPLEVSFLVERFSQFQQRLSKQDIFSKLFIADYFFDKSLIFAQQNLKDDQFRLFYQLYSVFIKQLPQPELLVFLLNTTPNLQNNIQKRGRPFEQEIADEYLINIHKNYMSFFRTKNNSPVLVLDITNADFVLNTVDFEKISSLVEGGWDNGLHFIKI